jgi:hypothetical protein
MILPTPGPLDYTRMFGTATPPDGAGPIGPDGVWPVPLQVTGQELLRSLNPLHHVPVVGMIYRAATGETIPTPIRVLGAGITGGGLGMIGAAFMSLLEELIRMGPDTSRPSTPMGMSQTGSESGMEPVTPGTVTGNNYLTLGTTTPEFLQNNTPDTAVVQNGAAAYQQASMEWQRSQAVEKGMV